MNRNLVDTINIEKELPFEATHESIIQGFIEALDTSNIVSVTDKLGVIEYVNDKFCEVSKYSRDELLGHPHNIVRHPEMPMETFRELWQTIKSGNTWQGVVKNRAKDGSEYIVDTTIVPIVRKDGVIEHYVSIRHDITDVLREHRVVPKQLIDELTGLNNRVKLLDDLTMVDFPAVSIINIDGFSEINDFYGLNIGDRLLVLVANKLKGFFNEPNHFVYRLRGDEFAVLTKNSNMVEEHLKKLDEMLSNLRIEPFDCDGHMVFISASSGSAFENDTILGKANLALKHARNTKKLHQLYDASLKLETKTGENLEWANKIQNAISTSRVVSYYQPIYNLATKKIEKYEALVRLVDENGTIISPWQFLEIAKKTKQYFQITKIMLTKAVKIAIESGYEISVNLSVDDLENQDILDEIDRLLGGSDVGARIVFELTETEDVKNYHAVAKFIKHVKGEYGSKIAIDDFGSGYSNFEHLLELDFDYLKIDGSIIQKLQEGKHSNVIVDAIKAFTDRLEIKTIAEYVSTKEIFDIVSAKGINYAQGFAIGKPEEELISGHLAL